MIFVFSDSISSTIFPFVEPAFDCTNFQSFTESVSELVELRDADGKVIDQTPTITDIEDDFTSWQRIYDGFDTDSVNDWKFVQSNAGSSNGKIAEEIESEKTIITMI